jgi:hypothetical protein
MKSLMLMNPNLSIATSSEQDVGNTNLLARKSTDSLVSISSSSNSSITVNKRRSQKTLYVLAKLMLLSTIFSQ